MSFQFDARARGVIVLAAGGTGGHLFPAQALGEELVRRGYLIHLMSDQRARDYGSKFPAVQIHEIPSGSINKSKPLTFVTGGMKLARGFFMARNILNSLKPLAVVGFGGYPSFPPLVAACFSGIPTCIHEQNAVMGRANRAIASRVTSIASSFPQISKLPDGTQDKVVFTGNPVRDQVLTAAQMPYEVPDLGESFNILIFGGSQGARVFSDIVPEAIANLPRNILKRLVLTQQVRPEDLERVEAAYTKAGITAELAPFFSDLPERIAKSHLVISRSGASTVAELAVIGRPSILVPYSFALDSDQLKNAEAFARAGAGWIIEQDELDADRLSSLITKLRFSDAELKSAAEAGKAMGKADAALRLADNVERIALESALKGAGFDGSADGLSK
jgi:UDP-N-acetylglucosamine--N-acetylmuramyl-(pentapeptide) pyrophosphoryl-undecaprenol N-acetylglucosamine transferase